MLIIVYITLKLVNINNFLLNDFNVSLQFRLSIFKSFIRPIWEYGLQICNFSKNILKQLDSIQYYFLARFFLAHGLFIDVISF